MKKMLALVMMVMLPCGLMATSAINVPWTESVVEVDNPLNEELPPEEDIYVPESDYEPIGEGRLIDTFWLLLGPEPVQVPKKEGGQIWAISPADRRFCSSNPVA